MVEVTQADREAAADILDVISSLLDHVGIGQVADLIRDGEYDEHDVMPIIARHRIATEARIVVWLDAMKRDDTNWPQHIARLIEQGAHDHD